MKSLRNLSLNIVLVSVFLIIAMLVSACGDSTHALLQETVDEINADEEMHAELEGLYTVHAEVQGSSTILVVFKAQHEDLASAEVAQTVSDNVVTEFQDAVTEMLSAGILDAAIVLEFLDTEGNRVYIRKFE